MAIRRIRPSAFCVAKPERASRVFYCSSPRSHLEHLIIIHARVPWLVWLEGRMKLLIKAELVYAFAQATQVIAIIEASHTSDQKILSESLDIQPPALLLFDKTPYGDRSIRASFSGEVAIRYQAVVENNLRQLLPPAGHQHLWSDLPTDVLPFLLPSRFCPSDKFMNATSAVRRRRRPMSSPTISCP